MKLVDQEEVLNVAANIFILLLTTPIGDRKQKFIEWVPRGTKTSATLICLNLYFNKIEFFSKLQKFVAQASRQVGITGHAMNLSLSLSSHTHTHTRTHTHTPSLSLSLGVVMVVKLHEDLKHANQLQRYHCNLVQYISI